MTLYTQAEVGQYKVYFCYSTPNVRSVWDNSGGWVARLCGRQRSLDKMRPGEEMFIQDDEANHKAYRVPQLSSHKLSIWPPCGIVLTNGMHDAFKSESSVPKHMICLI